MLTHLQCTPDDSMGHSVAWHHTASKAGHGNQVRCVTLLADALLVGKRYKLCSRQTILSTQMQYRLNDIRDTAAEANPVRRNQEVRCATMV